MEMQCVHNLFERRCINKAKTPAVKWFREWVPQDGVATGGRCKLLKWVNENTLKALKEKAKEPEAQEIELEPTTEVLFLYSYEGCGKTFIDAGTLRKHSHIHGEKQYFCHYEGCGKKFLDSSKLKSCGKAFALDFNLRSHMKTHSQENYHNPAVDVTKYATPLEKTSKATKSSVGGYGSAASADRPYACPYEDENAAANAENEMDEASDQDAYAGKPVTSKSQRQQSRAKPTTKMPPSTVARKGSTSSPVALNVTKKPWPLKEEVLEEEDSEETEEDQENGDDRWRYGENNEEDDEAPEYED
ncbi:hypothetical protein SLA2020_182350 [Shorea laevis]